MDGPVTAPLDDGLLQDQESRSVAPPKNFVYQIQIKKKERKRKENHTHLTCYFGKM